MEEVGPMSPGTPWGIEALWIARSRGWNDGYRAFDRVVMRYLSQGDTRPLEDLLEHARVPGRVGLRYIAAMIDREFRKRVRGVRFPYEILFEERRGRGRPSRRELNPSGGWVYALLETGVEAMSRGHRPDEQFWKYLLWALQPWRYRQSRGKDFPCTAKLARTNGSKGRRQNPELEMRDRALGWDVRPAIEAGETYEAALSHIAAENNVSEATARNAYSRYPK
jgi:hypothetical protein